MFLHFLLPLYVIDVDGVYNVIVTVPDDYLLFCRLPSQTANHRPIQILKRAISM